MPGRYQSLLDMLPCDLFRQIRNRTLWIVGDSNAQRFYKQLHCFLAPFLWPPGQNVHDRFTYDRNYVAVSRRCLRACCRCRPPAHRGKLAFVLWMSLAGRRGSPFPCPVACLPCLLPARPPICPLP